MRVLTTRASDTFSPPAFPAIAAAFSLPGTLPCRTTSFSGGATHSATAIASTARSVQEASTVFLAHDLRHYRDVAIKVLHPDLGADRFLSEIRTTARLQHPHILPLLDSGGADGLLYYVMPLVTGETLRTRLDREK